MWAHATEQGDAGSPGSGGASPYLRRACRVDAPCDVTPGKSVVQSESHGATPGNGKCPPGIFMWVHATERGDAGSPGSGRASPSYQRRGLPGAWSISVSFSARIAG
jgi:hypothetical protein